MYMTGFADEAAASIEGQIKATQELGWKNIESRAIDGVNIHDLDDDAFDVVYGKLQDAGISINCFGSTIANWSKQINEPMDADREALSRAIPRMKRLGTKLIRIMSYAVLKDRSPEDQMKGKRFERLRIITDQLLEAGIQPVHENCMNYGGMGWSYTLALVDNVPGLKLVFDIGNPVFSSDRTKPEPFPRQSSWEFYQNVKEHITYIHVKDGTSENGKITHTYPGDGMADVRRIMEDLIRSDYKGGISIEPHMGTVFHDDSVKKASEEERHNIYVKYGRRMERMITEIKASL